MSVKEYTTKEEILALADPDPELTEWLSKNPIPKPDWSSPVKMREMRKSLADARFSALPSPGTTIDISLRDGDKSQLRIYHPPTHPSDLSTLTQDQLDSTPLIVILYGGGFITGDNRQQGALALSLSRLYNAVVVLPTYRLAPENPFPTAQHDTLDSLFYISSHAAQIGASGKAGFVLGGISAGANLSAALGQYWQDESLSPPLTGLWLSIPAIFLGGIPVPDPYTSAFLSREQNADTLVLNADALRWVLIHQRPDAASRFASPFSSPNPARHMNLAGKVRVYFQVAGQDPLRDDGLIYERVLRAAGVETKCSVYSGMPHGHQSYFAFTQKGMQANLDVLREFGWLLGVEGRAEEELVKELRAPGGG